MLWELTEKNLIGYFNMNKQVREDLLITALEGGSNYWYWLDGIPKVRKNHKSKESLSDSEKVWRAIQQGQTIAVFDCDNQEEILGTISKERIKIGEELMKKNSPEHWMNANEDNWDAETADVWFQYVVLGEITFG